jgi:hypothetical protein
VPVTSLLFSTITNLLSNFKMFLTIRVELIENILKKTMYPMYILLLYILYLNYFVVVYLNIFYSLIKCGMMKERLYLIIKYLANIP